MARASAAAPTAAVTFSGLGFLGPIGTLIDTFLSIIQPIMIDAATVADTAARQQVIEAKLNQGQTRGKIETAGKASAMVVDNYSVTSRRRFAGLFDEQLISIENIPIDLTKEKACKEVKQVICCLPSGAPSAIFIACWKAAWAQIEIPIVNLIKTADSYDFFADVGPVNAQKLFDTITKDYAGFTTEIGVGRQFLGRRNSIYDLGERCEQCRLEGQSNFSSARSRVLPNDKLSF